MPTNAPGNDSLDELLSEAGNFVDADTARLMRDAIRRAHKAGYIEGAYSYGTYRDGVVRIGARARPWQAAITDYERDYQ